MLTLIRLLILFFCLIGYFLFMEKKGVPIAFAPFLTVTGICIIIFCAGILNFMVLAVVGLILGGYFSGLYAIYHFHRKSPPRGHASVYVLWSLTFFLLWFRLQNAFPSHYDNFSHWLLAVSDICLKNQFPIFDTTLIDFRSYPPGSACVIYFFCKVIGTSEVSIVFAQAVMYVSCLTAMCSYIKKNFLFSYIVLIATWVYILASNTAITDLLVDTLLPCAAIASTALILYFREDIHKQTIFSSISGIFLLLIKNSGIFFIALNIILPFFFQYFSQPTQKLTFSAKISAKYCFISISAPAFIYFIWSRHVDYVFSYSMNKHTLSLQNYYHILSRKSLNDLEEFALHFLRRVFTPDVHSGVLVLLIIIYGLHIIWHRATPETTVFFSPKIFAYWSIFTLIFYIIALAAMYIFSMPKNEAIVLSSYNRYFQTLIQYLVGIFSIYLLQWIGSQAKSCHPRLCSAPIVILLILCTILTNLPTLFYLPSSNITNYDIRYSAIRHQLHSLTEEYHIPKYSCYYIITDDSSDYIYYLAKYEYQSQSVSFTNEPTSQQLYEAIQSSDYLIIMSEQDIVNDCLVALGISPGEKVYSLSHYR